MDGNSRQLGTGLSSGPVCSLDRAKPRSHASLVHLSGRLILLAYVYSLLVVEEIILGLHQLVRSCLSYVLSSVVSGHRHILWRSNSCPLHHTGSLGESLLDTEVVLEVVGLMVVDVDGLGHALGLHLRIHYTNRTLLLFDRAGLSCMGVAASFVALSGRVHCAHVYLSIVVHHLVVAACQLAPVATL